MIEYFNSNFKLLSRRSRSRERQRSRSMERLRRKVSRSPIRRYSPRRRSRTRSRSLERRTRKRSPFINELTRQLRNEAIVTSHINTGYAPQSSMDGIPSLMNANVYQQESESRPPMSMPPYMHQSGLPPAPPMPSGVAPGGPPPFMNFENSPQPMNFDAVPVHPLPPAEYVSGPVMYNQPNTSSIQPPHRLPLLPAPISPPQPESAGGPMDHAPTYSSSHGIPPPQQSPIQNFEFSSKSKDTSPQNYRERRFNDSYNGYHGSDERLKTPEPPVISDTKVIVLYIVTENFFYIFVYFILRYWNSKYCFVINLRYCMLFAHSLQISFFLRSEKN